MNSILRIALCVVLVLAAFSVTVYLIFALKEYFRDSQKILVSFIDFVITEDTAFELLFIFLIGIIYLIFS